ncbi:flagellar basal body P-ring formation chaperone FlgA [Cellvibrio sp. KY-GH-1]|uniref:flagellar basal body P-ring formation chaperone FlgA n=1 Tax=Cellvibrio sp. KY-GH-1 TaxID=2303332 RepID=UPI0012471BB7|nr:flagellar basal body P-ring formation chaperone FlgA [Cellvibrio sp. KY-GH-1]
MSATFPHGNQRGKTGGSKISPFIFLVALSTCAIAGEKPGQKAEQTLEQQIDQAIHQHLQTLMNQQAKENGWQGLRLAIENTPLTRTQQLAPCPTEIHVSGGSTTKLARQQLTLECAGAKGWLIKVSSDVQLFLPVVISTSVINRGDTIQRNQLKLQENDITRSPRGFYHRLDQVTNMGAKRRIRANQILSPDLIDQPQLIKRGEKIKIIANRDGISASMPGEALEKGGEGEIIRVKNLSSGKTIEAKVVGAGVVSSTF